MGLGFFEAPAEAEDGDLSTSEEEEDGGKEGSRNKSLSFEHRQDPAQATSSGHEIDNDQNKHGGSSLPSVNSIFSSVTGVPEYLNLSSAASDNGNGSGNGNDDHQSAAAAGGLEHYRSAESSLRNEALITDGAVLREHVSSTAASYLAANASKILRDIATLHGVRVNLQRPQKGENPSGSDGKAVEVVGEQSKARAALQDVLLRASASSRETKAFVRVDAAEAGQIIGKEGSMIRKLQGQSGATIEVQSQGESATRNVFIRGGEAAVEKAKELIKRQVGSVTE
jgi:hypothetical protein